MFKWLADTTTSLDLGAYVPQTVKEYIPEGLFKEGNNPLQDAVTLGSLSKTIEFIEKGDDKFVKNDAGNGLLHLSCINGHIDISQKLLEYGLSINDRGNQGNTPLHFAAKGNHEELVTFLIEKHFADHQALNDDKRTPYDMTENFVIRKYLLPLRFPKNNSKGQRIGLGGVPLESPTSKKTSDGHEGSFFGESFRDTSTSNNAIGDQESSDVNILKADGFVSSSGKALGNKYGNLQIDQKRLQALGAPPTTATYYNTPSSPPLPSTDGMMPPPSYSSPPKPYLKGRYVEYDPMSGASKLPDSAPAPVVKEKPSPIKLFVPTHKESLPM